MSVLTALPDVGPFREVVIDLPALRANVEHLRSQMGVAHTMVVVKANAYGHGMVRCAQAALEAGADWLGVADIAEALRLRDAGITAPVLAWLHAPAEDFVSAVAANVTVGITSVAKLEAVAKAGAAHAGSFQAGGARVHLKVDTGLSRNGFAPAEWSSVFARAVELQASGAIIVEGIFSHLSNTSEADDDAQQIEFDRAVSLAREAGLAPTIMHLSSSLTAMTKPSMRYDMVRIGIAAYGLSPQDDRTSESWGLRPVMTVRARVSAVRRVPAGTGVSYDYTYRTATESTLALVPIGYGEGVPRTASDTAPVEINGNRYRISGRVAMDQFLVDVGDAPLALGDEVVLFGDPLRGEPSAADWAAACGTIAYDIVTGIGGRLTPVFVE
jgi:alanine racemase